MKLKEPYIIELKKFGEIRDRGYWSYFIQADNLLHLAVGVRPYYDNPRTWQEKESNLLRVHFSQLFNKTRQNLFGNFNLDYGHYIYRDPQKADEFAYNSAKTITEATASLLEFKVRDLTLEEPFFPFWRKLTQRV